MTCGIYKITNKVNGKVYVGQSQDIERRWGRHKWELENNKHHNTHLQRAFNKYGVDSFIWEIIAECEEDELDNREIFYISEYDSYKQGYNQTIGGEGNRGWKPSEETKRKMSEASTGEKNHMYGKHHSEETKKKISEANQGENNYLYGKHINEEIREKMSEAHKGKKLSEEHRRKISENHWDCSGENHPRSKKVLCVETGVIYGSVREASQKLNLHNQNISSVCKGKLKTTGGYHFKYVD